MNHRIETPRPPTVADLIYKLPVDPAQANRIAVLVQFAAEWQELRDRIRRLEAGNQWLLDHVPGVPPFS